MWHVASCGIPPHLPCLDCSELTCLKQELWGSSLRAAAHCTAEAHVAFFKSKNSSLAKLMSHLGSHVGSFLDLM